MDCKEESIKELVVKELNRMERLVRDRERAPKPNSTAGESSWEAYYREIDALNDQIESVKRFLLLLYGSLFDLTNSRTPS